MFPLFRAREKIGAPFELAGSTIATQKYETCTREISEKKPGTFTSGLYIDQSRHANESCMFAYY